MENIIIEKSLIQKSIADNIPKIIEEMFSRSYSNPMKEAVENAIKEKNGEIKTFVQDLLKEIVSDVGFRDEVKNAIVAKILLVGFKN